MELTACLFFNKKTSLVIGLPMTTAGYNSDNPFASCKAIYETSDSRNVSNAHDKDSIHE
jgi:hypothetical protein